MTPQAFSYPTVSNNGKINIPPYGLEEVVDYMLKFDPVDNSFKKITLKVNALPEKWQCGKCICCGRLMSCIECRVGGGGLGAGWEWCGWSLRRS